MRLDINVPEIDEVEKELIDILDDMQSDYLRVQLLVWNSDEGEVKFDILRSHGRKDDCHDIELDTRVELGAYESDICLLNYDTHGNELALTAITMLDSLHPSVR